MGNLKDYGTSTVLVAPSPASSGTSLEVQIGHGARFPAVPFTVTLHPPSEFPNLDNAEKLLVTAKSTNTFTITRAQGDTTAKAIEAGWRISNTLFLADIPVIDATSVEAAGAVMETDTSTADMNFVVDEDDMVSNSATKLSTQQSIKAYVDAAISSAKQALMPVGTVVALGVSTNPNPLYGFGTWSRIEGMGIIGVSDLDADFNLNDTGGAKTHTLLESEMPIHNHGVTDPGHSHTQKVTANASNKAIRRDYNSDGDANEYNQGNQTYGSVTGISINNTGGGGAHNNMQPYISKYLWERIA